MCLANAGRGGTDPWRKVLRKRYGRFAGDPNSGAGAGQHRLCGYLLSQGPDGGYDYSNTAAAADIVIDQEPAGHFRARNPRRRAGDHRRDQ